MSKKLDDEEDPFYEEDYGSLGVVGTVVTFTEYEKENPERSYQTTLIGFVTDDATPTAAKPQRHKKPRVRNART